MAVKFRNRYLICSLHLKDASPALLKSVTRQAILNALFCSLQALCGDVGVGGAKASLTIKDMHHVVHVPSESGPNTSSGTSATNNNNNRHGGAKAGTTNHIVFLLRTDRAMVREVRLAATCVTEVDMRVARITVEDMSGGLERVKERWLARLEQTDLGADASHLHVRLDGLET